MLQTIAEIAVVAALCAVAPWTLYRWRKRGGGAIRVRVVRDDTK